MSKCLLRCRCYLRSRSGTPLGNHSGFSTEPKPRVIPDRGVLDSIDNAEYKPRKHPGIVGPKTIRLPEEFVAAVARVTEDYPVKTLAGEASSLGRYLRARHVPLEREELKARAQKLREGVLLNSRGTPVEANERILRHRTLKELKRHVYNWTPVKYDVRTSLLYLVGRSAAEYAVLSKIMTEISRRDPEFQPKSLFDFGSGVGTATWAAIQFWRRHIFEYYNVDVSRDMNDLSLTLLQGGSSTGKSMLKGVFHRQFLPATTTMYDLVICAYSLFELPDARARLETALNLWNRTGTYLIIVEHGTNAGFRLVNELRDFLLHVNGSSDAAARVFSPCPHDDVCPRFVLDDGTPCNFEVYYFDLPMVGGSRCQELYSYVVLKKGAGSEERDGWPRVVRPTLVRSRHCICRTCTADGHLQEVIFTGAKHGKTVYHCARHTEWGDRLPIKLERGD